MNKADLENMRAFTLRWNANWYRDGLYREALRANNDHAFKDVWELLNYLAKAIEAGQPQTIDERAFLAALLRAIASGRDVRALLHMAIPKTGNRQHSPLGPEIAREVQRRRDDGQRLTDACVAVAEIISGDADAVKATYYQHKKRP